MTEHRRGLFYGLAAAVISGFSVLLNSFAVREFGDPVAYTTVKNAVAALILTGTAIAVASVRRERAIAVPSARRDRAALLAVGVIGGGAAFALFFTGLAQTSSTSAAFVQKTLVVWVAVLAVAFLRERFTGWHAAAIGLLVVGQAAAGGMGPIVADTGSAMVLLATLLWSGEVVIARPLLTRVPVLTVAVARLGVGVLVLLAIVVASGSLRSLIDASPAAWLWVLATGIVLSAYVACWYSALARASAIDVTAVLVFGAVITGALSATTGRVTDPLATTAGAALVAFGVGLVLWRSARRTGSPGRAGGHAPR